MTRARGRAGERGFALADFMAGLIVLSGVLLGFAALTRTKLDALRVSEANARALAEAEAAVDRVRREGLPAAPAGKADADGYRPVSTFKLADPRLAYATGSIEARVLRVAQGEPEGLCEVRVTVEVPGPTGADARVRLSTLAPIHSGSAEGAGR